MVESYDPDDDKDFLACVGECTYTKRRDTVTRADGTTAVELIEFCTGCGRVYERRIVDDGEGPPGGPGSTAA